MSIYFCICAHYCQTSNSTAVGIYTRVAAEERAPPPRRCRLAAGVLRSTSASVGASVSNFCACHYRLESSRSCGCRSSAERARHGFDPECAATRSCLSPSAGAACRLRPLVPPLVPGGSCMLEEAPAGVAAGADRFGVAAGGETATAAGAAGCALFADGPACCGRPPAGACVCRGATARCPASAFSAAALTACGFANAGAAAPPPLCTSMAGSCAPPGGMVSLPKAAQLPVKHNDLLPSCGAQPCDVVLPRHARLRPHPSADGTADDVGDAARSYRCASCAASMPPSPSACASTASATSASLLLLPPVSLPPPLLAALPPDCVCRVRELRCRSSIFCGKLGPFGAAQPGSAT